MTWPEAGLLCPQGSTPRKTHLSEVLSRQQGSLQALGAHGTLWDTSGLSTAVGILRRGDKTRAQESEQCSSVTTRLRCPCKQFVGVKPGEEASMGGLPSELPPGLESTLHPLSAHLLVAETDATQVHTGARSMTQ